MIAMTDSITAKTWFCDEPGTNRGSSLDTLFFKTDLIKVM